MKKIKKSQWYLYFSILIFGIAIFELLKQRLGLGYALIAIGYYLLRKSDFEK
ncbi:hypothetical protein LHA31_11155 [Carnobacterium viridans]|uniref:hypothetical protein n=1 Tax=Carnobacterium viridans TaxID=174587 RepID=UPI000A9AB634|nr:hypothetical protein [Carnobacterium viridans]UDE95090.1 hypothetical protein LHA31_11155 [Carnobacterium viridans]